MALEIWKPTQTRQLFFKKSRTNVLLKSFCYVLHGKTRSMPSTRRSGPKVNAKSISLITPPKSSTSNSYKILNKLCASCYCMCLFPSFGHCLINRYYVVASEQHFVLFVFSYSILKLDLNLIAGFTLDIPSHSHGWHFGCHHYQTGSDANSQSATDFGSGARLRECHLPLL